MPDYYPPYLIHSITLYTLTGDKQYKFDEILPIYDVINKETDTGTMADFMEGFKTYDREGQGFISAAELRTTLCMMGRC